MWSCSDRGAAVLGFPGQGQATTSRSRSIGHRVGHGGREPIAPVDARAIAAPSAPGSF